MLLAEYLDDLVQHEHITGGLVNNVLRFRQSRILLNNRQKWTDRDRISPIGNWLCGPTQFFV